MDACGFRERRETPVPRGGIMQSILYVIGVVVVVSVALRLAGFA